MLLVTLGTIAYSIVLICLGLYRAKNTNQIHLQVKLMLLSSFVSLSCNIFLYNTIAFLGVQSKKVKKPLEEKDLKVEGAPIIVSSYCVK